MRDHAPHADLEAVRSILRDRIEELAAHLLGEPSLRRGRQWRWGGKGSLALEVGGSKRGLWINREADKGGDALALIAHARQCSFADAIAWAVIWTGQPQHDTAKPRQPAPGAAEREAEERADKARRIGDARKAWGQRNPYGFNDTPAETYLTVARGIPRPWYATGNDWPGERDANFPVSFHKASHSLILAATTADGAVQAVQRVRLTADGQKAEGTPERPTKWTNGVLADAAVRLPGNRAGPLLLAEGPETGLSLWVATGHETWIALGSVGGLTPPPGRLVVICRDDDKRFSPADRKIAELVNTWRAAGADIRVATPWAERREDKSDFNDTMQQAGAEAIRARVEAAINPTDQTGRRRVPLREGRRQLDKAVSTFFGAAAEYLPDPDPEAHNVPPVHAVRVDVGVGKSLSARRYAAEMLAAMRARGDIRNLVLAVPTHKLAEEQAAEFEGQPAAIKAGLRAAIWRGREAADIEAPGHQMCRNLEAVRDAQAALANVEQSACKTRPAGGVAAKECPFYRECGYQRQRKETADLWIVPHDMLFAETPAAIGKITALVVDESAWQDGLEGVEGRPVTLPLDALRAVDAVPGDPLNTDRLAFLRHEALDAIDGLTDGPLIREAFEARGFTSKMAGEAGGLEWTRKVDPGVHPLMPAEERRAAVKAVQGNSTIARLAMFWRAVKALLEDGGPQSSGWAELALEPTEKGPVRMLRLKGRRPIRKGWLAPTLLIDATINPDLVRPFWPQVELTADVAVQTPFQHIKQAVDLSYSKRRLVAWEGAPETQQGTADRNLRDLHATLAGIARTHAPGLVLVVVQQAVEAALPTIAPLPPNLLLAHHNAVAGRDEWKNVAALVVVGRTQPPPAAVERLAEALTGSATTPLDRWYPRACTTRTLANGETLEAEADRHPDATAEAIRWQICEGEITQIIGRGRGVNREAANPLGVLVLCDVPLPLPVNETCTRHDLAPTIADLMLAAGGVAFTNGTDAATAYPSLWNSREAAKKAIDRASLSLQLGTNPYRYLLIRECPQPTGERPSLLRRVDYQLAGAGKRPVVAFFDPAMVPDPVATLAAVLGPLAMVQAEAPPPQPPAPSPSATVQPPPRAPDAPAPYALRPVPLASLRLPAGLRPLPPDLPPPDAVPWGRGVASLLAVLPAPCVTYSTRQFERKGAMQ